MDCLYNFHYNEGPVYPPALSNQRLMLSSTRNDAAEENPAGGCGSASGGGGRGATNPIASTDWFSVDMELAFRLGLLMLAVPRPQHSMAAVEVRLFDREAALLSRLYRLPLDSACPWVIESVRREAHLLVNGENHIADCLGESKISIFFSKSLASCWTFLLTFHFSGLRAVLSE